MKRETIFSPCRKYRYTLWREWDCDTLTGCSDDLAHAGEYVMFIGLNPSTADETKDDPTIRRCIRFAKQWGYGAMCMTNIFAWRDTDPAKMKLAENPGGIDNQHHLLSIASEAGLVVAAWGNNGASQCRDLTVRQWLSGIGIQMKCFRITQNKQPQHPLYVAADTTLIDYP